MLTMEWEDSREIEINREEIHDLLIRADIPYAWGHDIMGSCMGDIYATIGNGVQGKAPSLVPDWDKSDIHNNTWGNPPSGVGTSRGQYRGDIPSHHFGLYNRIPSEPNGKCCDLLLAYCFDADNFKRRLDEVTRHVAICPQTKCVLIFTTQWNAKEWKKNYESCFRSIHALVRIFFVAYGRTHRIV